MIMTKTAFTLKHVVYKDILAIEQLAIAAGEITCIVGESGSGKTTLLRLLNKLVNACAGDIYYREKSLVDYDAITLRRQVVMLSQSPIVFDGNLRDNLTIGLKFAQHKMVDDDVLMSLLQALKLDKALDQSVDKLSGGEKQRLTLGRVMLLNPDVFLMDEPTAALDDDTALSMITYVVDHVKEHNKTLVIVTHDKQIATRFGNQIFELNNGRVVKATRPKKGDDDERAR